MSRPESPRPGPTDSVRRRRRIALSLLLPLTLPAPLAWSVAGPASAAEPNAIDLRVDVDRDGVVSLDDGSADGTTVPATRDRGALFLANLDDDARRCKMTGAGGDPLTLAQLATCYDGADKRVNGSADELDLARIKSVPMAEIGDAAQGQVSLDAASRDRANLFVRDGSSWRYLGAKGTVSAALLRSGLELGIEGRDVRRAAKGWNGRATVTVTVNDAGTTSTDSVSLFQAPVLTSNHTEPVQRILVSLVGKKAAKKWSAPKAVKASQRMATRIDQVSKSAGLRPAIRLRGGEIFPQDHFEQMFTSMPGAGGKAHTMRVLLRSPQSWRYGARELYRRFRGVDSAVIRVRQDASGGDGSGQTLSSMGNLETIPPYTWKGKSYPHGRALLGADPRDKERPAPSLLRLLRANGQAPLVLDAGWTFVEHIDESIQFLPADNERGWKVAIADPAAGLQLLRDASAAGHGDVRLFPKKLGYTRLTTIDEYLDDPDRVLVAENKMASRRVEANLRVLERETGITEADVVRVPTLFGSIELDWGHEAGTPRISPLSAVIADAVNGVVLDDDRVVVPRQKGPRVAGRELFADAVRDVYAEAGFKTTWVADDFYHRNDGEIHCATNTFRRVDADWWQTG
ncbi:protein-arginine deiminase family protein [Nocardioides sp. GXZ039]|uniref:protein-arginine deiminase family protein n=1 Tax=Nocardioides sp. GXZ039 TaxID=3136018 RepID=UPI0030F3BF5A